MATRNDVYEVLAGGFRKQSSSRHGFEVRMLGIYTDGDMKIFHESTGLGTNDWFVHEKSPASVDNDDVDVPIQSTWNEFTGGRRSTFHGGSADVPCYAIPSFQSMFPEGHVFGNCNLRLPETGYIRHDNELLVSEFENYIEIRETMITDSDDHSVKKPLTFFSNEDRTHEFLNQNVLKVSTGNILPKTGAIEFKLMIEKGKNKSLPESTLVTYYGEDVLDKDAAAYNEYSLGLDFNLRVLGGTVPLPFYFGIWSDILISDSRVTSDYLEFDDNGEPTHWVAAVPALGFDGSSTAFLEGYVRDSSAGIVKFEFNKWYRFRIEWETIRLESGVDDFRVRFFHGDPVEKMQQAFFYWFFEYTKKTYSNGEKFYSKTIDEDYLVDEIKFREFSEKAVEVHPATIFKIPSFMSPPPIGWDFTSGEGKKASCGQKVHVGRIGYSWDDNYVEYGTSTELAEDPVPAVIEAEVVSNIEDEDITVEIEYYPAILDKWNDYSTGYSDYKVKEYKLDPEEKTFTFTIPAFTRIGRLFQGPSDFGMMKSITTSAGNGSIEFHMILTDGAKIIHALKPIELLDSMYKLRQCMSKGPRPCPRCGGGGMDDDYKERFSAEVTSLVASGYTEADAYREAETRVSGCLLCEGKRFLKDDHEIQEFILDNFLESQGAPFSGASMQEKIGMAFVCNFHVDPSREEIKRFLSKVFDISESSIDISIYDQKQNIVVVIGLPSFTGPNAMFGDYSRIDWILETIRPLGIEYFSAEIEEDILETDVSFSDGFFGTGFTPDLYEEQSSFFFGKEMPGEFAVFLDMFHSSSLNSKEFYSYYDFNDDSGDRDHWKSVNSPAVIFGVDNGRHVLLKSGAQITSKRVADGDALTSMDAPDDKEWEINAFFTNPTIQGEENPSILVRIWNTTDTIKETLIPVHGRDFVINVKHYNAGEVDRVEAWYQQAYPSGESKLMERWVFNSTVDVKGIAYKAVGNEVKLLAVSKDWELVEENPTTPENSNLSITYSTSQLQQDIRTLVETSDFDMVVVDDHDEEDFEDYEVDSDIDDADNWSAATGADKTAKVKNNAAGNYLEMIDHDDVSDLRVNYTLDARTLVENDSVTFYLVPREDNWALWLSNSSGNGEIQIYFHSGKIQGINNAGAQYLITTYTNGTPLILEIIHVDADEYYVKVDGVVYDNGGSNYEPHVNWSGDLDTIRFKAFTLAEEWRADLAWFGFSWSEPEVMDNQIFLTGDTDDKYTIEVNGRPTFAETRIKTSSNIIISVGTVSFEINHDGNNVKVLDAGGNELGEKEQESLGSVFHVFRFYISGDRMDLEVDAGEDSVHSRIRFAGIPARVIETFEIKSKEDDAFINIDYINVCESRWEYFM